MRVMRTFRLTHLRGDPRKPSLHAGPMQVGRVTGPLRTCLGLLIYRMGMMGNSPKLIHVQAHAGSPLHRSQKKRKRESFQSV